MRRQLFIELAAAAALGLAGAAQAQVSTIDPNAPPPGAGPGAAAPPAGTWETDDGAPVDPGPQEAPAAPAPGFTPAPAPGAAPAGATAPSAAERASASIRGETIPRKDVFSAAEGVFGRGAEGLGDVIERLLKDQGEPSAYITGREAGGAFVVGLRYGSGTLHHQIEGDRPVYWTGPSVGFDAGADASKVFVLVYNLHDSQRLYRRYPAAEGNAYAVGGFTASYLRRGDIVLIPVRLGVGARLGVNAGYMRFSERNRWLPF
ncbi:MAG: DUF1134 domain-containing protein [Alphaproteobacteria bacterium]|nr:DUF1134 domain-containing protein [Alphaproteobacteria bacterium]MBV9371967.1 DUF1134 domain-containing protein [Alphaproteobacteria bacterium]MBV9901950.1 DUF1134 domain-containing protein [Alphaproteobacteria bacterium]